MKVLFYLGHPAHYHNIRNAADILTQGGHQVVMAARKKDVLLDLVDRDKYEVVVVSASESTGSKLSLAITVLAREVKMWSVVRRFRPDILVGTDIVITHVGRLMGIPSVVLNEDDAREVPLLASLGFKYADHVMSPRVCDISPYEARKVAYESYHELGYLHPNYFQPDPGQIAHLIDVERPYFVLRFSSLAAHHDEGRKGIDDALAERLIRLLEPHGTVYITSERTLGPRLEPYRMAIHPSMMHQVLYHARLYIGDSQTMAAEAAVLGTPSIRFNDFVGKLGYLEELEHVYQLTFGIPTNQPEKLFEKVEAILAVPDVKTEWQRRRERMLAEKIDFTAMLVWFLEKYPASYATLVRDPGYLARFR